MGHGDSSTFCEDTFKPPSACISNAVPLLLPRPKNMLCWARSPGSSGQVGYTQIRLPLVNWVGGNGSTLRHTNRMGLLRRMSMRTAPGLSRSLCSRRSRIQDTARPKTQKHTACCATRHTVSYALTGCRVLYGWHLT
jgi:hypothetical protein